MDLWKINLENLLDLKIALERINLENAILASVNQSRETRCPFLSELALLNWISFEG
jgi:hypothetical protein